MIFFIIRKLNPVVTEEIRYGKRYENLLITCLKAGFFFFIALFFFSGCCLFPKTPKEYRVINTDSFNGEYEEIVGAVSDVVKEKGFKIGQLDKYNDDTSVLITYTSNINPDYYYGFFPHSDTDGYCDCGVPPFDWVYSGKMVYLNVFFIPSDKKDLWNVRVNTKFTTTKTYDRIIPVIQPLFELKKSTVACKSTGKLEDEILSSLRKRLSSN